MSDTVRHEVDTGDLLVGANERSAIRVLVIVEAATAHLVSVQHTVWMMLNELARLSGVIAEIGLVCPPDVALAGRVVPLASRDLDLASALLDGCAEIGIVAVNASTGTESFDKALTIGPGEKTDGLRVHGEGWWGGYSTTSLESRRPEDPNPIGPYVAASLAVGELFCAVALRKYEATERLFLSAWTLEGSGVPPDANPPLPSVELDTLICGVGAVGSMVVHVLWATEFISGYVVLCDADPDGVDATNLNRYVLFGQSSAGNDKASAAATIAADASVNFHPIDGPVQTVERFPDRVVSAVDINIARAAIQSRYPARILSASTSDLRAEVLRIGIPHAGVCLRCFNPPEEQPDDNALREAVRTGEYGDLSELAAAHDVTIEEVEAWVIRGKCGRASERLLPTLRNNLRLPPNFAVSFVSSLAGVLLAAELLKDHYADRVPLNDTDVRFVFQFAIPVARTNRASRYLPQPTCPLCGPDANQIATKAWEQRARGLQPAREGPTT
jgi:hypothetical protein